MTTIPFVKGRVCIERAIYHVLTQLEDFVGFIVNCVLN